MGISTFVVAQLLVHPARNEGDATWSGLPGKAEPLPLLYTPTASPEHLPDAPIMLFNKIIQ